MCSKRALDKARYTVQIYRVHTVLLAAHHCIMATRDIPIKYVNNSGSTDFKVVVFTKNFSQSSGPTHYTAWQVLHAQSVVEFMYPAEVSVGALYKTKGQTIMAGPFPAKPGSTWSVEMDSPSSSAILTEGI